MLPLQCQLTLFDSQIKIVKNSRGFKENKNNQLLYTVGNGALNKIKVNICIMYICILQSFEVTFYLIFLLLRSMIYLPNVNIIFLQIPWKKCRFLFYFVDFILVLWWWVTINKMTYEKTVLSICWTKMVLFSCLAFYGKWTIVGHGWLLKI